MMNSKPLICKMLKSLFLLAWLLIEVSEKAMAVDFWQPITDANLRSVVATEERIVAVGEPGFIMTSTNGVDWQQCVSPTPGVLNAVTFGDGQFLAVGRDGTAIKSSDGVNWQRIHLGLTNRFEGAHYLSNRFVVVGYGIQGSQYYGTVQTSSNLTEWQTIQLPTASFLRTATQVEDSLIVAGGNTTFEINDNLTEWRQLFGFISLFNDIRKFQSSPIGLLAVGNNRLCNDGGCNYNALVALSTNIVDWQWTSAEISTDLPFSSVTYGNGKFVAVGSGGLDSLNGTTSRNKGATAVSTDGLNWLISPRPPGEDLYDICFFKGRFVAVGHRGLVLISEDGIEWTKVNDPLPALPTALLDVAYGDGLFVAVGYGGAIITSTNGWWWEPRVSGVSSYLQGIVRGTDCWVATGAGGVVLRSSDGYAWEQQAFPGTYILTDVAFGAGMFVAVAGEGEGNTLFTSPDGSEWTPHLVTATNLSKIAYDSGKFFATGHRDMASSINGLEWETYSAIDPIAEVLYDSGLFIGLTGLFQYYSTDFVNWFQTEGFYGRADINSLISGPGGYVAAGQNIITVSRDGTRWSYSAKPPATSFFTSGAAYGAGLYVLAGTQPCLLISRHHFPQIAGLAVVDAETLGLQLETDSGLAYELQATGELGGDWVTIIELSGNYETVEIQMSEQPQRFFRAVPKFP